VSLHRREFPTAFGKHGMVKSEHAFVRVTGYAGQQLLEKSIGDWFFRLRV
jgi:hypothetical protein